MELCGCGEVLETPHEKHEGQCNECEQDDLRFLCGWCQTRLVFGAQPGEVQFCGEKCEEQFNDALARA